MKIVVIDGQGGRMGSLFIERWKKENAVALHDKKTDVMIMAVGTNSLATAAMLKAGADAAATGENPVKVNVADAEYIVGPIGILAADALHGEITAKMAKAVAKCAGEKILIPANTKCFQIVGVGNYTMNELIDQAVERVKIR